jgi:hypothetical protein
MRIFSQLFLLKFYACLLENKVSKSKKRVANESKEGKHAHKKAISGMEMRRQKRRLLE